MSANDTRVFWKCPGCYDIRRLGKTGITKVHVCAAAHLLALSLSVLLCGKSTSVTTINSAKQT